MLKKVTKLAVIGALALNLQACAGMEGPKELAGTLLGAVGGAVAGSQFGKGNGQLLGVAIGTLAGASIGKEIGKSLDNADQAIAQTQAIKSNVNVGETIVWNNPDSGNKGTVTVTQDGYDASTRAYCREYLTTVVISGKTQEAYGTACRQPDGSWQMNTNA